jgi:fatty acid desaturase
MSTAAAGLAPGLEPDYTELRRAIVRARLLERAYAYYAVRGGTCFAMLAIAAVLPFLLRPAGWLVLGAPLLAFAVVQVALIGHDAGHLEVFRASHRNHALGSLCWTLVAGVGFWYWNDRHNRHHGHTNDLGSDPDLAGEGLLAVAYTEADGSSRTGWRRAMVRYQTLLIPIVIPLLGFAFRVEGTSYALRRLRGARRAVELGLLGANVALWLGTVLVLGWRGVVLFVACHVLAGMYLSAIIAPNHKGMPVWEPDSRPSFVERQVLSSRNVSPGRLCDFFFGGLNYQIEHHLFPTMPRANLGRARAIVRPYCLDRHLDYTEVGMLTSYRMVYAALSVLRRSAI